MKRGLFLAAITLVLFLSSGTYETSGDVRSNEYVALSLVKDRDLDLQEFYTEGAAVIRYASSTGHSVAVYPTVAGIVAAPVFGLAHMAGFDIVHYKIFLARLAASLIAVGAVMGFYYFLKNIVREQTAWWAALGFGLGTHVWSIASRGLWQHGTVLLFMNFALYCATRAQPLLFWSGVFSGLAMWARPSSAIFFIPFTLYILYQHKSNLWKYAAGGIVASVPFAVYSWKYIGSVFSLGQLQTFIYGDIVQGFLGSLFSPGHGLFTHAPIFVFSFVVMGMVLRKPQRHPLLTALCIATILHLAFYSSWFMWWGGWTFGYRMLLEIMPALITLLAVGWEQYGARLHLLKWVAVGCLVWTFAVELLGVYAWPCVKAPPPNNPEMYWELQSHPFSMCTNKASLLDKAKFIHYYYEVY